MPVPAGPGWKGAGSRRRPPAAAAGVSLGRAPARPAHEARGRHHRLGRLDRHLHVGGTAEVAGPVQDHLVGARPAGLAPAVGHLGVAATFHPAGVARGSGRNAVYAAGDALALAGSP